MMKTIKLVLLMFLALSSLSCSINSLMKMAEPKILIYKQTYIRFASLEEGQKLIGDSSDWVKSLSSLDRKLRMKKNDDISEEEFLSFSANQVVKWKQNEINGFAKSIDIIRRRLGRMQINLDLPEEILLIKTTGEEQGGPAVYTRGNAIIISEGCPLPPPVEGILHELFHIMTNHSPSIREPLYSIIGYHPCNNVVLPVPIKNLKITNPDAFYNDFFIEVSVNGVPTKVIPIIYSEKAQYIGGYLVDYLTFKLMALEYVNGIYVPLTNGKKLVLFNVSEVTNFYEQIGQNTDYVIHPEETMAKNFTYMIMEMVDVPNPEILDSMSKFFRDQGNN
jgi:hypothetical protein